MEVLWKLSLVLLVAVATLNVSRAAPSSGLRLRHQKLCSRCPPGMGTQSPCNSTHDTVCAPCPPGYFSEKDSPEETCLPCSLCGWGMFELRPCNSTNDAFCELCSWISLPENEDYVKRCVSGVELQLFDSKKPESLMEETLPLNGNLHSKGSDTSIPDAKSGKKEWMDKIPSLKEISERMLGDDPGISNPETTKDASDVVLLTEQSIPEEGNVPHIEPFTVKIMPKQDDNREDQKPVYVTLPLPELNETQQASTDVVDGNLEELSHAPTGGSQWSVVSDDSLETEMSTGFIVNTGGSSSLPGTGNGDQELDGSLDSIGGDSTTASVLNHNTGEGIGVTDEYSEEEFLPPNLSVTGHDHTEDGTPAPSKEQVSSTAASSEEDIDGDFDSDEEVDSSGGSSGDFGSWDIDFEVLKTTPKRVLSSTTTRRPYRYTRRRWLPFTRWPKTTTTTTSTTTTTTPTTTSPSTTTMQTSTHRPTDKINSTATITTTVRVTTTRVQSTSTIPLTTNRTTAASTTEPSTSPKMVLSSTKSTTGWTPPRSTPTTKASNESVIGVLLVGDPDVGEMKNEKPVPTFAIFMAALTAGIIFFALGFFLKKGGSKSGYYSPESPSNEAAKPVANHYKMVPIGNGEKKPVANSRGYVPKVLPEAEANYPTEKTKLFEQPPEHDDEGSEDRSEESGEGPPVGKHQSPIDIDVNAADLDDVLEKNPLNFQYKSPGGTSILRNTGSAIVIEEQGTGSDMLAPLPHQLFMDWQMSHGLAVLTGGPLGDKKFCLNHIVFHWGASDSRGSEHSVNAQRHSGEIQFIHWNCDDYVSYAQASKEDDGLAGVAVFLKAHVWDDSGYQHVQNSYKLYFDEVEEDGQEAMTAVASCLQSIQYKDQGRELPDSFNPAGLLPGNKLDYWSYQGSLTRSPYSETVTWIVFKEPLATSHEQIKEFRRMMKYERSEAKRKGETFILDNFRNTQPLKDRTIRASFV